MAKAVIRHVDAQGDLYDALLFWCPGCEVIRDGEPHRGLHMLPITGDGAGRPVWGFDGNLEAPTLTPSILTRTAAWGDEPSGVFICHSFLRAGQFEFLGDCTHSLAGQTVPLPDLPDWAAAE